MYYLDPDDQARFGLAEPDDPQPQYLPGTVNRETARQRKEDETRLFIASLQRGRVPDVLAQHLAHLSASQWQILHSHLNFRTRGDNRSRSSFVAGFATHPRWTANAALGTFTVASVEEILEMGRRHSFLPVRDVGAGRADCRLCCGWGWRPLRPEVTTTGDFVVCTCPPDDEVPADVLGTMQRDPRAYPQRHRAQLERAAL